MFRTTVERTQLRAKLVETLRAISVGDTITHKMIEIATGLKRDSSRPILHAAMKVLNKESGVVFASVHDVGYQRLPVGELPSVGSAARKSIARKSRRTQKVLTNALAKQNVENDVRVKLHTELAVLGIIELSAGERSYAKVSASLSENAKASVPSAAEVARHLLQQL